MKRENPLLMYRNWFIELNLSLADRIAHAVFRAILRYRPLNKLLTKQQTTLNTGAAAINLLNILDHQIALQQKFLNKQFAMILFRATRICLHVDGQQIPLLLEEYKELHIRNLVSGNQSEATYFEQLMEQLTLEFEQQNTWRRLEAFGFNFGAIHSYMLRDNTN